MKKPEQVHSIFQKIAGNYDRMNSIISLGTHNSWRKDATSFINIRPNMNILDDCCGTGDWTVELSKHLGRNGSITGLDFSENMLEIAKRKLNQQPRAPKISLIQGDAMNLPFNDNQFDAVTIGFGLRNISDRTKALSEIYRVLKPGGQLVCLETSQPTAPGIRQGWQVYFGHIVPWMGKVLVNEKSEYTYLTDSTNNFVNPQILVEMFQETGFQNVYYSKLLFGSAAIHVGTKEA